MELVFRLINDFGESKWTVNFCQSSY